MCESDSTEETTEFTGKWEEISRNSTKEDQRGRAATITSRAGLRMSELKSRQWEYLNSFRIIADFLESSNQGEICEILILTFNDFTHNSIFLVDSPTFK